MYNLFRKKLTNRIHNRVFHAELCIKDGRRGLVHAPLMLLCAVGSCFCFRKHVSVINNLIEDEFTVYGEVDNLTKNNLI